MLSLLILIQSLFATELYTSCYGDGGKYDDSILNSAQFVIYPNAGFVVVKWDTQEEALYKIESFDSTESYRPLEKHLIGVYVKGETPFEIKSVQHLRIWVPRVLFMDPVGSMSFSDRKYGDSTIGYLRMRCEQNSNE